MRVSCEYPFRFVKYKVTWLIDHSIQREANADFKVISACVYDSVLCGQELSLSEDFLAYILNHDQTHTLGDIFLFFLIPTQNSHSSGGEDSCMWEADSVFTQVFNQQRGVAFVCSQCISASNNLSSWHQQTNFSSETKMVLLHMLQNAYRLHAYTYRLC